MNVQHASGIAENSLQVNEEQVKFEASKGRQRVFGLSTWGFCSMILPQVHFEAYKVF